MITKSSALNRVVESLREWGRVCWYPTGQTDTCGRRFEGKIGGLPEGYDHKYIYSQLGFNLKSAEFQGAVGCRQLRKLDDFGQCRRKDFEALTKAFNEHGLDEHFMLARATAESDPGWFGFPLTIRDSYPLGRHNVIRYLEEHEIGTRPLFAGNIIRQPAIHGAPYKLSGPLVNTDNMMTDPFWIGVWPGIGAAERDYIVEVFTSMVSELVS